MDAIPMLSKDRKTLAFSSEQWCAAWCASSISVELYVSGLDGSNAKRLTTGMTPVYGKSFSPDGQSLVFESAGGSVYASDLRLYVIRADGTGMVRITNELSRLPDWSPDATRIAYCAADGIVTIRPDGGDRRVLLPLPYSWPFTCYQPRWSPDGRRIAYSTIDGRLWVMNADGSGAVQILDGTGYDSGGGVTWSPDGQWLAFQSTQSGSLNIWVVRPDGTGARNVTNLTSGFATGAAW